MTQRDRELRAVTVLDLMMLIADFAFVLHQNSAVHQSASYHLARGDGVFRSLLGSRLVRWVWAIVVGLVFAMAGCWAHDEFVSRPALNRLTRVAALGTWLVFRALFIGASVRAWVVMNYPPSTKGSDTPHKIQKSE